MNLNRIGLLYFIILTWCFELHADVTSIPQTAKLFSTTKDNDDHRITYLLQWEKFTDRSYYEIQISLDKKFSKTQNFFTDEEFFYTGTLAQKKYFFRYRVLGDQQQAISSFSSPVTSSEAASFIGKKPLTPQPGENLISQDNLTPLVFYPETVKKEEIQQNKTWQVLRWPPIRDSPHPKAHHYEIQIAANKDFKDFKRFYNHKGIFHTLLELNKDYYVRYRLKNIESRPISQFSATLHRKPILETKKLVIETIPELSPICPQTPNKEWLQKYCPSPQRPTKKLASEKVSQIKIKKIEKNYKSILLAQSWAWLGTGIDYSNHTQDVSNFSDLNFQSFTGPSFSLSLGHFFNPAWGLAVGYKNTTGQVDNISNSQSIMNYHLQNYSAEVYLRPSASASNHSQWILQLGLQSHQVPLIKVTNFPNNTIKLDNPAFTSMSLGGSYFRRLGAKWSGELMLRTQWPLIEKATSGNEVTISPTFSFDGSLGFKRKIHNNYYLGLFWYGQWHQFDYSLSGGNPQKGTQQLLQSHIDLRFGLLF